jgi:hypothetical protein
MRSKRPGMRPSPGVETLTMHATSSTFRLRDSSLPTSLLIARYNGVHKCPLPQFNAFHKE